jgi:hypothetical protein
MNQLVEVELVDLGGVELSEASPHVLEQRSQLRLVIGRHQFPCSSTIGGLG